MKKPWYQYFMSSYVPWVLAGVLFIGSLLDTLSNAVEWINPFITYFGTAIIIGGYLIVKVILRSRPLPIVTENNQTVFVSSLGRKPQLMLLGIILTLWLPRIILQSSDSNTEFGVLDRVAEMKLISVTPEANTSLSYDDLTKGVPLSAVIEYSFLLVPEENWTPYLVIVSMGAQQGNRTMVIRDLAREKTIIGNQRLRVDTFLTTKDIYENKITIFINLEYHNPYEASGLTNMDSTIQFFYPVIGVPTKPVETQQFSPSPISPSSTLTVTNTFMPTLTQTMTATPTPTHTPTPISANTP